MGFGGEWVLDFSQVCGTNQSTPLKEPKKASNTLLISKVEEIQDYLSNQKISCQRKL